MALTEPPRRRAAWRIIVACTLTALVAAITVPDILLPWHPFATYGFDPDPTGRIVYVAPQSAAADAGLRVGERVDVAAANLAVRRVLTVAYLVAPEGQVATFPVVDEHGVRRDVTLKARIRSRSTADNVADVVQILGYVVFLVTGALLVLLRPSGLTWSFLVYALCIANGSVLFQGNAPLPIGVAAATESYVLGSLAWVPFTIFALRFPTDHLAGWRLGTERALLWSLAFFVPAQAYVATAELFGTTLPLWVNVIASQILPVAGAALGSVVFIITYVHAAASDRPRIRWVIAGFVVGYSGLLISTALNLAGITSWPLWFNDLVQTFNVAVPLTVAYAIFKHRVIDVQFYLNRALVYGLLTTGIIVGVAILHWIVSKQLEELHFGIYLEIAGVLAIGVSLQKLHGALDRLVDRFVFRSIHDAEEHLAKVAASMLYAQSIASLDRMVGGEPLRALHLASAAVYRIREESGEYELRDEAGAASHDLEVERDAPLVLAMYAGKKAVETRDSIAFPFVIRDDVVGFAIFGAHVNGSSIDPNEREILETFVERATIAYDHFTSKTRAVEIARLRTENETLRSLVGPRQATRTEA
jgi:hypothetical protein